MTSLVPYRSVVGSGSWRGVGRSGGLNEHVVWLEQYVVLGPWVGVMEMFGGWLFVGAVVGSFGGGFGR